MELEYGENALKEYLLDYFQKNNMPQSQIALEFAHKMHQGQKRKEGIPYIVHPMAMARHALMTGLAEDDLIAVILLHDVCEDCDVGVEELPVNERIRQGVRFMTCKTQEGETKAEAKERYYFEMRGCKDACIGKVFDRCHNVSSMAQAFSVEKLQSYIEETEKYIYPLIQYNKKIYPEVAEVMWILEYHIKSVIVSIKKILE